MALVVGVILFAGACFWVLSPWQFGRNSQRSAQNSDVTNAVSDPAVPLRQLLPVGAEPRPTLNWRAVTFAGRYLPADETVARLRQVNDEPAYEVLTPFRLDDGRVVLVDRGWVTPSNGQVPGYASAPLDEVTLTARMHPEESDPHRPPLTEQGHREIYSINTTVVSDLTGLNVDPGYFTLVDNQPGLLNALPLPQIDSGPFLSYALQWIVFGVMAIGGLGYFTWREIQPGGALTPEGRARRRAERDGVRKVRGRHAVAALIAEDEARERANS
jgi:cytochrome oxidase assembly protein ShyY1